MEMIKRWLETHGWPWKALAQLKKERDEAIHNMQVCYDTYTDGYNAHWRHWITFTNCLYGQKKFDDNEINLMRRFYDEGMNSNEAIERFKEYRGIGRYAHPFTKFDS